MKECTFRVLSIENDVDFLYKIMFQDDQYLFCSKVLCNTVYQFKDWLVARVHGNFNDFYIVEMDGIKIGYAHTYEFSLKNGHCKMVIYTIEKCRDIGIGGIIAIQFMKKLFSMYPLRKIYIDVYDYNKQSYNSNIKAGFIEEAELKGYRYYAGEFHSMHILSITRERFESIFGKMILL